MNLSEFQKEDETFKVLHAHLRREEYYWRLKYRNNWILAGDRNTKFFHKQANFREIKNNISQIHHGGHALTNFEDIKKAWWITSTSFIKWTH